MVCKSRGHVSIRAGERGRRIARPGGYKNTVSRTFCRDDILQDWDGTAGGLERDGLQKQRACWKRRAGEWRQRIARLGGHKNTASGNVARGEGNNVLQDWKGTRIQQARMLQKQREFKLQEGAGMASCKVTSNRIGSDAAGGVLYCKTVH